MRQVSGFSIFIKVVFALRHVLTFGVIILAHAGYLMNTERHCTELCISIIAFLTDKEI
jgi:hypothetical protein